MDIFSKLLVERTPLRLLTVNEGPLGNSLYQIAEKYFLFPFLEGPLANRMHFNGKEMIIWSVNNYLGLGNHPALKEAEKESLLRWGLSIPMGARMFSGDSALHHALEQELAEFTQKESALILNYGYQGMISLIDSLVDIKDIILYDAQAHACIVDGVRMHQGKRLAFMHNDIANLRQLLARSSATVEKEGGGILVITEGVFGMAGEQGKIKEIVDLKKEFEFRFLVDDAHGFGVVGPTGAGIGELQQVQQGIDLYFGTFAKAFASIGAFVSGDLSTIESIKFGSRSQMFAKTLPLSYVETNLLRLKYARQNPYLLEKLWVNVALLQKGLKAIGFNLGVANTQITSVYLDCSIEEGAKMLVDMRETYGVFCSAALYPVVPRGIFLFRLIPTAAHTENDIEQTITAFANCKKKLNDGYYLSPLPDNIMKNLSSFTQSSAGV